MLSKKLIQTASFSPTRPPTYLPPYTGMAIQNQYIPGMAVVGEAGWGGAGSTNWWACPETDTIIVAMTQVGRWVGGWVGGFVFL